MLIGSGLNQSLQPRNGLLLVGSLPAVVARQQPLRPAQSPRHSLQGEKNHGFEVLYQGVKQGPISTKELADFIRER
jgi:hypothetical protein